MSEGFQWCTTAPNTNPGFAPVKCGLYANGVKFAKPPKPPEKPLMPYMRFSRKVWDKVRASHENCKLWEIGKVIGQMWRELGAQEKDKFVHEWEAEKIEYNEALKTYHNSPVYQQFLNTKEREKQQEEKDLKSGNSKTVNPKGETTRVVIASLDQDSEELDQMSIRQLSASRYQRNQKLLLDVFGDSCVPDSRSIVTTPRMSMLKKQVHSLTSHQRKLEVELEQLETQFQAKKRCIAQNSTSFQQQLAELTKPQFTATKYEDLIEEASKDILKQIEEKKNEATQKDCVAEENIAEESVAENEDEDTASLIEKSSESGETSSVSPEETKINGDVEN